MKERKNGCLVEDRFEYREEHNYNYKNKAESRCKKLTFIIIIIRVLLTFIYNYSKCSLLFIHLTLYPYTYAAAYASLEILHPLFITFIFIYTVVLTGKSYREDLNIRSSVPKEVCLINSLKLSVHLYFIVNLFFIYQFTCTLEENLRLTFTFT